MKREIGLACATIILVSLSGSNLFPDVGPFDGRSFKARIAYSADGIGRIVESTHKETRWLLLGQDSSGRGRALIFTRGPR
jgi:hypothetical protein